MASVLDRGVAKIKLCVADDTQAEHGETVISGTRWAGGARRQQDAKRSAIVHPFRLRRSLIGAAAYLPPCSHGCVQPQQFRQLSTFPAPARRVF